MKTSHKKNRPFDFKLISLVEPHPVLYVRQFSGMSSFEIMKTKNKIWQDISAEMGSPVKFCLSRWNNLKANFQKELKQSQELCPVTGLVRVSTWPYLERLQFLQSTHQTTKPKKEKPPKREVSESPDFLQESDNIWNSDESQPAKLPKIEIEHDLRIDRSTTMKQNKSMEEELYDDSFSMIEEIAEEVVGTEEYEIVEDKQDNFPRIESLLNGFEEEYSQRIERRLMAFLCKCQLRSLCHQTIDDLTV